MYLLYKTLILSISTPNLSATICEKVVSWACPCASAPVYTSTVPSGLTSILLVSGTPPAVASM